jgi:single-strand DNA-binding protein
MKGDTMIAVTMIGTLSRDPEMRGEGENKVCSMHVIELGRKKAPVAVGVSAFDRLAENCGRYLCKGRHVAVFGRLRRDHWQAEDGEARETLWIEADHVEFLPGGKRADRAAEAVATG